MKDPTILKKFSQKDADSPVIFTGDKCVVTILQKLEKYECLSVRDTVTTLGVFDMEVDGVLSGCFLVARVEMCPSEIETVTIEGKQYLRLTFKKGDVFFKSTKVVAEDKLPYYIWVEFVKFGNVLRSMSYAEQAMLFDRMRITSGMDFPVDHVVYETIFAHLSRSPEDFTVPFRNTDMKGDFIRVQLNDVAHSAKSTSSRIIGSNFKDGVNAALNKPSDTSGPVEDLLRT